MTTKLKIPDAAYVIGTTPLSVRKWLEKNQISWLAGARFEKGRAAEFGTLDLLRMRLVVVLLGYGANVAQAAEMVTGIIPAELSDDDVPALADIFPGEFDRIIVTRNGHRWSVTMINKPDDKTPPAALVIKPSELFGEVLDKAKALQDRRAWAAA